MKTRFFQQGFHLIEMMICIAMISIISALGITSYQHHLNHAKRLAAEVVLSKLAIAMEQYYMVHDSYLGATLAALGSDVDIANHAYQLQIEARDQDYVLLAVPAARDDACGTLQLDASGKKYATGGTLTECW